MKDFKDKSKIQVHVSKNMFDRKYSEGKSNSNKKDTIRRNGKIGVKSNNTRELNRGFSDSGEVREEQLLLGQSVQMVDVSGSS